MDGLEVAEVGSFTSRAHAEMAAGMLDAHGVRADVMADDAGGALPHVAVGSHGFRVHVADGDQAEAEALLADLVEDTADADTSPAHVGSMNRAHVLRLVGALTLAAVVVGVLIGVLT